MPGHYGGMGKGAARRYKSKKKNAKQAILKDDARGYRKRRVAELRADKNHDMLQHFIGKNATRKPRN
jgi:hypothetical protein|tara:strand:- start:379 stop:579 length:201 start_codon:yes stop_codon:yes gene_type:complete